MATTWLIVNQGDDDHDPASANPLALDMQEAGSLSRSSLLALVAGAVSSLRTSSTGVSRHAGADELGPERHGIRGILLWREQLPPPPAVKRHAASLPSAADLILAAASV
jgi:hypothetical protein